MSMNRRISPLFLAGTAAVVALAGARCTGRPAPEPAAPPASAPAAASASAAVPWYAPEPGHATSFEEAKTMAASRGVPILVDFFSPT